MPWFHSFFDFDVSLDSPTWFIQLCDHFGLHVLPNHISMILLSALTCHFIYVLSHLLSMTYSKVYPSLRPSRQIDWNARIVSTLHALFSLSISLPLLWDPFLIQDKAYGYTLKAGNIYAVSCGYFLWDSVFSLAYLRYFGFAFCFHGLAAFGVFFCAYRPFLMYFGAAFLIFEGSTPCLNGHWFLDKLGYTGSRWQLYNGIALLSLFFICRIALGGYFSMQFYDVMTELSPHLSMFTYYGYVLANFSLNLLNVYWWMLMVASFRRRLRHRHRVHHTPIETLEPKKMK